MPLHDRECRGTSLMQAWQLLAASVVGRQEGADESRHGDVGLVTVLLEEHPLQRLGAFEPILGQKAVPSARQ